MKSDPSGFLIADKPVSAEALARGIGGVRADTHAILSILKTGARQAVQARQRVTNSGTSARRAGASDGAPIRSRGPGTPPTASGKAEDGKSLARSASAIEREGDERGRFMARSKAELTTVAKAINSMTRKQAKQHAQVVLEQDSKARAASTAATSGQGRDMRGRFIGAGGGADGAGGGGSSKRDRDGASLIARMKNLFTGLKTPTIGMGDFDKVDPTVEASKELGRIVSGPLNAIGTVGKAVIGRGFGGAKNTSVSWFRRILKELHLTRTQASEFGLAETRVLKDIERKTGGGAGGKEGGGLLGGLLGGVGGLLSSLLGVAFKGGKGLLKRLPLLGALFAGGAALASIFGGDDPNKTPEQNRSDRFSGAGSGIGSLLGGGIGMLLGGPVGAMIGGVVGDKVGELVGAWLSTVDWSAVGKTITDAWDSTVATVKDTWKTVTDKLSEITKTVGDAWSAIISGAKAFVKDKFGIDIDAITAKASDAAKPAVQAVQNTVGPAIDKAKELGGAAVDYAKERATKMAAPIANAASNALDYGKGLFGGGSKGVKAAVIAQAATIENPNERAAFLAQTDHESGGFRNTEENLNYSAAGLRKTFGTYYKTDAEAQADAKNPETIANRVYGGRMGNTDPGDGYKYRGRGVMQLTGKDNYEAAGKALGIDLVNNPDALKDPDVSAKVAMWYWDSRKGLAEAARAGDDLAVRKKVNGGTIGLDDTKAKTASYLAAIKAGDPALSATPALSPPVITAAASAAPPMPPMPTASAPPPPAAPPTVPANIPQQLNTPGPIDVRVSKDTTVGQDLSDRRLAQIATGGIAPG
jgi:predicted chitinase